MIQYLHDNYGKVLEFLDFCEKLSSAKHLNKHEFRFLKSQIIEQHLTEKLDKFKLAHNFGYDMIYDNKLKISVKSGNKLFQNSKKNTTKIVLANQNRKENLNRFSTTDYVDFDYLMLISLNQKSMAICKKDNFMANIVTTDQLQVQIPYSSLEFIVEPGVSHTIDTNQTFDKFIDRQHKQFISKIINKVNA